MKKIVLLIVLISIGKIQAQSLDLTYSLTPKSLFGIGLNLNDLFGKTGFYFKVQGIGVDYSSESGVDYSSISDRTEYSKETIEDIDHSTFIVGLTFNLKDLFILKKDNLHLAVGIGYDTRYTWVSWSEYYIWDDFPNLNESNFLTRTDMEHKFALETTINYAIMDNLGFICGYNTAQGFVVGGFFRLGIY